MPEGSKQGILEGMYLLNGAPEGDGPKIRLLGSGSALPRVREVAKALFNDHGVRAEVWSVTSFPELQRLNLPNALFVRPQHEERKAWNTDTVHEPHEHGENLVLPVHGVIPRDGELVDPVKAILIGWLTLGIGSSFLFLYLTNNSSRTSSDQSSI